MLTLCLVVVAFVGGAIVGARYADKLKPYVGAE